MRAIFGVMLASAVLLGGCGSNRSCKDACSKLQSCNLNSAGLSCDSDCGDTGGTCAECLNDTSCGDITGGKCASHCPGVQLSPK